LKIKDFFHHTSLIKSEVRLLLKYHLCVDDIYLILNEDKEIQEYQKFKELIQRRIDGEPIEYITNMVSFYSKQFIARKGVLIARPESELLVDKVIEVANGSGTIAEIGVGSGIVSIMLSLHLKKYNFIATDIDQKALDLASENISLHKITNIDLRLSSLLDEVSQPIDIIVSNPPYIADDYIIDKNLEYEPSNALFGGKVGDEILKEIIDLSLKRSIKYLICEMGYDQKEKILNYLKDKKYKTLKFYKDLSGFDRGFILGFV